MNKKDRERQEAIEKLRQYLKPGDTVYTDLTHVSRSGMYRAIRLFIIDDGTPWDISYMAAPILEGYDERWEGCKASGCGMDMGFHLVYNLSYALFSSGWECTGDKCPSNDHINHWNGPRGQGIKHSEGGYALRHKWL